MKHNQKLQNTKESSSKHEKVNENNPERSPKYTVSFYITENNTTKNILNV